MSKLNFFFESILNLKTKLVMYKSGKSGKSSHRLYNSRYISCSCYKTQICYYVKDSNKVYACHCSKCILDNDIYNDNINRIPIVWVNIRNYDLVNEFAGEFIQNNNYNDNDNNDNNDLLWIKTGCFSKRGYCKYCKDIMLIDYYLTKYIKDMNIVPVADLYCYDSTKQLTNKCYNSVPFIRNL